MLNLPEIVDLHPGRSSYAFYQKGLLIAVLLLTAGCTELRQLTQLPTEEAQHTWAIIQRQEEIAAAGGHKFFLPYITRQDPVPPPDGKQPIGGGHSMPPYTDSYYITSKDLSVLFNMGCAIGRHDLNTPGVQDNLIILDFGIPKRLSNGVYGVSLMGYGPISVYEVGELTKVFGLGYYNCSGADMESQLRLGIGTNNYGNTTNPAITFEHGAAWANIVNDVNAYFSANTRNRIKQQVDAVGANDIELSWNTFEATKKWLDGYDSVNLYTCIISARSRAVHILKVQMQPAAVIPISGIKMKCGTSSMAQNPSIRCQRFTVRMALTPNSGIDERLFLSGARRSG